MPLTINHLGFILRNKSKLLLWDSTFNICLLGRSKLTISEIKVHLLLSWHGKLLQQRLMGKNYWSASWSKQVHLSSRQRRHFPFRQCSHSQVWHLRKSHSSIKNGCVHVWLSLKSRLQPSESAFTVCVFMSGKDGSRFQNNPVACVTTMLTATSRCRGRNSWDKTLMQGRPPSVSVTLAKVIF